MWVYPVCKLNTPHSFLFQQTSDNAEKVKEIKRRVQSLSGVLASPVGEDDYAEKGRRAELRRFVLVRIYANLSSSLSQEARGGYREA
jgi:hypothetical protein